MDHLNLVTVTESGISATSKQVTEAVNKALDTLKPDSSNVKTATLITNALPQTSNLHRIIAGDCQSTKDPEYGLVHVF